MEFDNATVSVALFHFDDDLVKLSDDDSSCVRLDSVASADEDSGFVGLKRLGVPVVLRVAVNDTVSRRVPVIALPVTDAEHG